MLRRTFLGTSVAAAAAQIPSASTKFIAGVCTHFAQGKGSVDANLAMIAQAGVTSIRDEASWGGVEREKDKLALPASHDAYVKSTLAAGLDPLMVLDYGNRHYDGGDKPVSPEAIEGFARYAEFMVRHFLGKIRMYEIWNEWDISIGGTQPGTAETYVNLLKAVYPRMKAIDPSLLIMGGGMTSGGIRKGWLDCMLEAGALASCDAVSIHTYNYSGKDRARTPEAWLEFCVQAEASLQKANNGRDVPLYVTEMGWPTHSAPNGTTPQLSAAYLARMYLLARTMPYLRGIWWYDFQDDGWRPEYNENNFGMVRPDLTAKPAYWAMKDIAGFAAQCEFVWRLEASDMQIDALQFRQPDGKFALALWSEAGERRVRLHSSARGPGVQIREAGRASVGRHWGARDPVAANEIALALNDTPIIVTGVPFDVTIKSA